MAEHILAIASFWTVAYGNHNHDGDANAKHDQNANEDSIGEEISICADHRSASSESLTLIEVYPVASP